MKPTRFFNVNDGQRLMVQNGFDARMICANGVVKECWEFAARAYMGETDREEIGRAEAEALALAVSGKKLTDLGVAIFPLGEPNLSPEDDRIPPGFSYVMDDSDSEDAVDQDEPVIFHFDPRGRVSPVLEKGCCIQP